MITGRFFLPPEVLESLPLLPEAAESAAEPSWANSSIGERVTDLLGEFIDGDKEEDEDNGPIPMLPVIVCGGGRFPVFSPELLFMLKGIVSGKRPGGGFPPIFIRPIDGLRFVAVSL